ncbi:heat-labile enterotoxin subunit alpha [Serratia symbiotica]|uniref:enterotoxin A family protein n=1 Tax=Serratia symbiotica TaxID=138074 RepID=UPI001322D4D6|nr:enterotoxin A family protein [Serratia symbiotica]MBF1994034.1 heat-labile enterotoxin subunit alpha [Serratia symbiotica]MBQ0956602.1 heat-labile enterotoxin subunit alpha [Serratia symbiotica]QTP15671.1 heat-labile enterotoxin subunit alpha [Serratia symbiotica]
MGRLAYSVALLFLIRSSACFAVLPLEVYRSVMEDPELVKAADGFLPKGMDGTRPNQPIPSVSLYNHAMGSETGLARYDSGYVSTTSSLRLAHIWSNSQFPGTSYIYTIQPTPNFIDVNASLGRYSPHPGEEEFAALGPIRWAQIIGWRRVHFNVMGEFIRNRDFNRNLYQGMHATESVPELAGFPRSHPAWGQPPWRYYTNCDDSDLKKRASIICIPLKSNRLVALQYSLRYDPTIVFIITK